MTQHSPMPWKYLEQTGFVVDANGVYIAQTWNKKEENFPNAVANGNAIAQLTAENAKLHDLLSRAADTIAELSSGGQHLVIMQEIDAALEQETIR